MHNAQQSYAGIQAMFAQLDALWAANLEAVPYEDARKMERVIHRCKEQCFEQLEALEPPVPRNLLSLVWQQHHCEVYAERHRVFVMTWGIGEDGDFSAFASPLDA